jgi:putative hydrolase of the HAD superfamily
MTGVSGILFDIDDTLVDFTGASLRALQSAVRKHLGDVPQQDVDAAWAAVSEEQYSRYTSGELDFDTMLVERMAAFVVALGPAQAATEVHVAIEKDRTGRIFDHYALFGDVRPELERLRTAGIPVGAVSNSDGDYQRRKLATVGLTGAFVTEVFSGDVGVAKPDPHIFEVAVQRLGTPASSTVYVGDRWDIDVAGARAAGLVAVWLDRRGTGPHPPDGGHYDDRTVRIEDLTGLAGALEGLSLGPL